MNYIGSPGDWERHQRSEISRFVGQCAKNSIRDNVFSPLYPGSMLFNQLALVDGNRQHESTAFDLPRIESLDAVYEALGFSTSAAVSAETLLIDCQSWWTGVESILKDKIEKHGEQQAGPRNVVVLYGRYSARIKGICDTASVKCSVIKPRWWCPAFLLCLYRTSAHVVFVDTGRSLDAAMAGARCSLVVGNAYLQGPVFPALFAALSQCSCCNISLPAHSDSGLLDTVSISVIENSRGAFSIAMGCEAEASHGTNTAGYQDTDPIIRTGVFWQQLWKQKVANTSISTRRKARKLVEDPRAFFKDSKLPCSGSIAALLPERAGAKDIDSKNRGA